VPTDAGQPALGSPNAPGPESRSVVAAVLVPAPGAMVPGMVVARVLFRVDRTEIDAEGRSAIDRVATAMKSDPALKVNLSGYADQSGKVDHNIDLAKRRAFAVRDALKSAGVAEDRIVLRKPELVVGTLDAQWRRVDIIPAR
jgi:outer membrane protein OmpA-like peptidoglycan-associated protein